MREVSDDARTLWTVWDTYPQSGRRTTVMAGYESGWLTFECEERKLRLSPVPPDWAEAPDAEVLRYLAMASVVEVRGSGRGATSPRDAAVQDAAGV
jgi:hypothetical protein